MDTLIRKPLLSLGNNGLIDTGGTCVAGVKLLRRAGAEVVGCSFIIDLPDLGGRARVEALEVPVHCLCEFAGD